jgi:catechol 2,3-dioxygenase-like lactoylglutathione lyase family enzyme
MSRSIRSLVVCAVAACAAANGAALVTGQQTGAKKVRLGNFSVSLAVKDLKASREFYEKLGFSVIGGNGRNWAILQNETATIGLFQGMFEKNSLTFNPGWDRNGKTLPEFDDVRTIQRTLKNGGLKLQTEADESSTGPASFVLADPDGNPILVDQHVPKPGG